MVGVWRLIPYINGVTDDPSEALQWLERAAAEGEPHAMEYLGMFYVEIGKRTGMGDLPRGVELFRRCTEQTLHSDCVFAYATALDMGMGVPRDPLKAYALYSVVNGRDSSNGRTPSQKTLTRMDKLIKELSREEVERAHNMTFAMWSKHPTPAQKAARESERHAECNVASEQFCRQ